MKNNYRLNDIAQIIDCEHETAPLEIDGIPSIRTPNIGKGRLILDGVNKVSEKTYQLWTKRAKPEPGDLILAREAPVGNASIIPSNLKVCLGQRTVLIKPYKSRICSEYLNYLINSYAVNNYLINISNGATVGHLNVTDIRKLKLPSLLPLSIQRKIAAVLSSYDDLIENNNRRIAILEKMAEELYREWFVRLRFPGHDKTKIVKGVPAGWEIKRIGEIVSYYVGGGWGEEQSNIEYPIGGYVIRGTDIPDLDVGSFSKPPYRFHKASNYSARQLGIGDFVFEVSGGSKDQLLGRSLLITKGIFEFCDAKVICASFCKLIRMNHESVSSYYFKYFLKFYHQSGMVGTYQIQSTGISNYQFESFLKYQKIVLPPKSIQDQFDRNVASILSEKDALSLSTNILKESRDRLLSRLMNGKINVENMDISFPPSMQEEVACA